MNTLEYENTQEIKNHGDPDFPFNIYPCSIPLDFAAVPQHWHNDMEVIYVKKGTGMVSVNLEPHRVQAGDIILVAPGQLHAIEQYCDETMEYENIIFQLNMLMCSANDICSELVFTPLLNSRIMLPVHITPESGLYGDAARCLDEIDKFSSSEDSFRMLGIKGKLFELFYLLFCHCRNTLQTQQHSRSLDNVKFILKHIETHYREPLSIQDMAELCGFSCSHFMKFFKQYMGTSFTVYLNDYRLTMAARMLSVSSDTIVAIAQDCGFENLSYFNRMFKRKYHVTPSQYRKVGWPGTF